jgi:hypothetical protein
MALVTLSRAKEHLRETTSDRDGDIQAKVEQATAIVLDYLKVRLIAIETITVANPTVITTSVPHSLTSGVTYTIAGTTTTPTVNGAQVVTVTSPTTFTVPVNVTVGQSAAAGTVGTPTWTEATLPGQVQAAILLVLGHLDTQRGDDMATDQHLWLAIERLLMRSRDPAFA